MPKVYCTNSECTGYVDGECIKDYISIGDNEYDICEDYECYRETAVTTLIDDAVVYTPTIEDFKKFKKKFKSEAYKEFARRLKCGVPQETGVIRCSDVDNLSKELAGENNA